MNWGPLLLLLLSYLIATGLAGCDRTAEYEEYRRWDTAVIVKICKDGTRIQRRDDGVLFIWRRQRVASLEVCE